MNGQLNRKLASEEVRFLMKTLETDVQASRNRLRDNQEKFENLSTEIICDSNREKKLDS